MGWECAGGVSRVMQKCVGGWGVGGGGAIKAGRGGGGMCVGRGWREEVQQPVYPHASGGQTTPQQRQHAALVLADPEVRERMKGGGRAVRNHMAVLPQGCP